MKHRPFILECALCDHWEVSNVWHSLEDVTMSYHITRLQSVPGSLSIVAVCDDHDADTRIQVMEGHIQVEADKRTAHRVIETL